MEAENQRTAAKGEVGKELVLATVPTFYKTLKRIFILYFVGKNLKRCT